MDSSVTSQDVLFLELSAVTGLDRAKWEEILALPPELQEAVLANYRDQSWADPGASTFERVLKILGEIGMIAGVVGGVAGAAGAVAALRRA